MKRCILGIIIFITVCCFGITASADSMTELSVLYNLNFVDSAADLDSVVTKGDFAAALIRVIGMDKTDVTNYYTSFRDLSTRSENYNALLIAEKLGIVSGDEYGNIRPDESISYNQAVKMLVNLLGYGDYAQTTAPYPLGHSIVASRLKLDSGVGVSGDELISWRDAAKLLYNSLDVKILNKITAGQKTSYSTSDSKTLLYAYHGIIKAKGTVCGTGHVKLSDDVVCGAYEVNIGGDCYVPGDVDLSDYLGYEVEYYYSEKDNVSTLLCAFPTDKNRVITISGDKVRTFTGTKIEYYAENSPKVFTEDIDFSARILYNSAPAGRIASDMIAGQEGNIKLIDSNGDGSFESVIIEVIKSFVVGAADINKEIVYDKYDKTNTLSLDRAKYKYMSFKDQLGNDMEISEIMEWDVLSVAESADKRFLKVTYSNTEVRGKISALEEKDNSLLLTINENVYETTKDFYSRNVRTIRVGDAGIFIMNAEGRIAAFKNDESQSFMLAYLTAASPGEGVDSDIIKIRVFTSDNAMHIYELNNNVVFDGASAKAADVFASLKENGEVKAQLIRIFVNEAGKVSKIEKNSVKKLYDDSVTRLYRDKARVLGGAISINRKTLLIKVPSDTASADIDDYGFYNAYDYLVDNTSYNVSAYRYNENSYVADVLVVSVDRNNYPIVASTPISVVKKISRFLTDDGTETYKITAVTRGEEIDYIARNDAVVDGITKTAGNTVKKHTLAVGDIIRISKNDADKIENISLVYDKVGDFTALNMPNTTNFNNAFRITRGRAYALSEGFLYFVPCAFSESLTEQDAAKTEVYPAHAFSVCVYDSEKREVRLGSIFDIAAYETDGLGDKMFVYTSFTSQGMIYIIK